MQAFGNRIKGVATRKMLTEACSKVTLFSGLKPSEFEAVVNAMVERKAASVRVHRHAHKHAADAIGGALHTAPYEWLWRRVRRSSSRASTATTFSSSNRVRTTCSWLQSVAASTASRRTRAVTPLVRAAHRLGLACHAALHARHAPCARNIPTPLPVLGTQGSWR